MFIFFILIILILLIFLIYKNYKFFAKNYRIILFSFIFFLILILEFFKEKFFFKKNSVNIKIEECIDCKQNLIEVFIFMKEQIYLTVLEFESTVKQGFLNELDFNYKDKIILYLNTNFVYNLKKIDLENLSYEEVSQKLYELNILFNRINDLNFQFLNLKVKYEYFIVENKLSDEELELLQKEYLNEIDNLFN